MAPSSTSGNATLIAVPTPSCERLEMLPPIRSVSEEAERLLALAESTPYEGPLPDGTASMEAGVAGVRAAFGLGGVKSTLEAALRRSALPPEATSPLTASISFGLGSIAYLSGEISTARKQFEEALERTETGQPLVRMVSLCFLSVVAADEGNLEEAESLAHEARSLADRFRLHEVPQSSWISIALGYMLAKRGNVAEAQTELEKGLSTRRTLPGLSPWPTLIALLALAQVRSASGDRGGAREVLAEARIMLQRYPDSGIFPELLERQERKLRTSKRRDGSLDRELTERELDVLGFLVGDLSTRQMAENLYGATSTVRTQIKSIYRKFGVSSRQDAVDEAHARGLI